MKATSLYLKYLLDQKALARSESSKLRRMHDLGLEPAKAQEPMPAWAEAFGAKLQRYWGGGIERENMPSV